MAALERLKRWLTHPLAREVDLSQPAQATMIHAAIIREKGFLDRLYGEWARWIMDRLPADRARVLELGSGGGRLKDLMPGLIASDIFFLPGLDLVLKGESLPFAAGSLDAIVMTGVLHHCGAVESFFVEARRCLKEGGQVIMVEPWVSGWSRLVYGKLHHEPFDPRQAGWELPRAGAFAGANQALPWMVFQRDRARFEEMFPELGIKEVRLDMPFAYLVSGGVSLRGPLPAWSYRGWRALEGLLRPWMASWAMIATVVLQKRTAPC